MFALVDCNNFYASCERLFRPELQHTPVAVLSNNDGCIIARSNEVKDLGIPMGAPYFKFKDQLAKQGVALFSSNYELYADMSNRVAECLRMLVPDVEVYSIDECFLCLKGFEHKDLLELGRTIRTTVHQWTGIPVGVGIAPTKTLAKVANKQAKLSQGVCVISDGAFSREILRTYPIDDLWGVGRQYTKKLAAFGVHTAMELMDKPDKWIRQEMTVQGLRLAYELRGICCIPFEDVPPAQKGLAVTRSFGQKLEDWQPIKQAMVHYATRAGEKLRARDLKAGHMQVFLHTSKFAKQGYYSNATGMRLPHHSDYTPELIHYATRLLKTIYRRGYRFAKCGIMLSDLEDKSYTQNDFFIAARDPMQDTRLMGALDTINRKMGKHTVAFAGAGIKRRWLMNRDFVSPCYTTDWNDIRVI